MSKIYIFKILKIFSSFCLYIFLFSHSFLISRTLLEDNFYYKISQLLYDTEGPWKTISFFKEKRYNMKPLNVLDKPLIKSKISLQSSNQGTSFILYNKISFKMNFYLYSYSNFGDSNYHYKLYEEINQNKLKKNEFLSGFGYFNNWIRFQICKGKESWGAGENMELALSENSEPYDYLLLGSNYGNLRVRYIHGLLKSTSINVNRFITSRGIEWSNKKSLILGISETVVYSGLNRSLDIGYINPISSHIEIELNNRLNTIGNSNSNAVWQFHFDSLIKKTFRFSINILIDEFVFDPDIEVGKEHGKALSTRISKNIINLNKRFLTLYSKYIYVGTPTFRHQNGENNFFNNSHPLGWFRGSDTQETSIGLNYSNKSSILYLLEGGLILSGDENILNRTLDPYKDYQKGGFPSGNIKRNLFLNSTIEMKLSNYFSITSTLNLSFHNINKVLIGLSTSIPISKIYNLD